MAVFFGQIMILLISWVEDLTQTPSWVCGRQWLARIKWVLVDPPFR